ncbi:RHS repeat-associated core domain-containing protein, partial [Kribbella sp. NPDC050124]|uniref:RHS repeat-associated core domain-containing protein n=1 Tax=Kribbella sp. NPDC050124 TaxID=3364114 RepID=UPI0037B2C2ED
GVSKKMFYGTNPHGDTETLTDATTGATTSTYRYTAYGQPDKIGTTGDDKIKDNDPAANADIVNPYRFNSKRFNGATGTYDMGFREYNPSLNRFLSRDYYDGALKDLALGTDPWNTNRYMFAGGNPITGVELDGHCTMADEGGCDTDANYTGPIQPQTATATQTQAREPSEPEARPHPDRYFEMARCNGGPSCVMPEGYVGKYGAYRPIPDHGIPEALLTVLPLPSPTKVRVLGQFGRTLLGRFFGRPARPTEVPLILRNKAIGDAASDAIAARFPGARREVTLQAASGPRRLDVLTPSGQAIESKVGRTSLDDRTRQELARDVELLKDPDSPVTSVVWEFAVSPTTGLAGPTAPLAEALRKAGIPWVFG